MDSLRIYDYLVLVRRRLFDRMRPLDGAQWSREFPIGPGALDRTLAHILCSEWYYVQRMAGAEVPPYETWPIRQEAPAPFARLEDAWSTQAEATRRALRAIRDWGAPIVYHVTDDAGRGIIVTTNAADLFTQLAIHEVHHRAQVMNILRHLGVEFGDLDFNALMFDRRAAAR